MRILFCIELRIAEKEKIDVRFVLCHAYKSFVVINSLLCRFPFPAVDGARPGWLLS